MVTSRRRPPDEDDRARGLIDNAVTANIRDWATMVDLLPTHHGFDQFSNDVAGALRACIHAHIAGDRENEISKTLRQKYLAVLRRRIAALKELDEAFAPRWPALYHECQAFMSGPDPINYKERLKPLIDAIRLQANELKLAGGRRPLHAFDALAQGLVLAYRRATGRSGVGYGAREGKLRSFVEKVLPVAREIAKTVTGTALETPVTPAAIGQYMNRVGRRTRGT
jgi:hypothetical protein